jgi:uncharacterized protein YyaL (SSP411 family)
MATVKSGQIVWREWNAGAFAAAQQSDCPILMSINAVWCHWCHVMAETTYRDPDVAQFVNDHFLPIHVDTDHRPDINARYNVGGWPTTSFLTPHGGYIAGATYLPADQFLAMLDEVRRAYADQKPQLYEQANDILRQRREHAARVSAGHEPDATLVDSITRRAAGAYDPRNGGFGVEPKFPSTPMLRLLLHQYRTTGEPFFRSMLEKTLDAITGGELHDTVDGGFFRFATFANWTEPQHEKMAEDNIALAGVLLDASVALDRPDYRAIAARTIDYVVDTLYDRDARGIRGSQGAHSAYFALSAPERMKTGPPPPDPSCYISGNGLAAAVLLDASWKLGREDLADTALTVLERLHEMSAQNVFSHVYTEEGPGEGPAFLADWAWLLTGMVQAHSSTARPVYLDRAVETARVLVDKFFDSERGGFFDIEADEQALGHMQVREKPLAENVAAVEALVRLYQVTRNEDYRQLCEVTLSAFVDTYREQGEFAAEYGLAIRLFKNPVVEVTVEGRPGDASCRDLLQAAARLPNPNLDIKTVRTLTDDSRARAHVCLDTVCLPPVDSADALAEAVSALSSPQASPFDDILRIFPGA